MPYIDDDTRLPFEDAIDDIVATILEETTSTSRSGMLNYVITSLIAQLLDAEGTTYNRLNTYVGVLECAKLELYRRMAAPYEDKKKHVNGDVYRPQV